MKTTIEISDALLVAAKLRARQRATTFRALVEEGLRAVLDGESGDEPFRLPDATVGGRGLQPGVGDDGWARIAAMTYEGRGG